MSTLRRVNPTALVSARLMAVCFIVTVALSSPVVGLAAGQIYSIDTAVAGATAERASGEAAVARGSVRVIRSPSFEVGPEEPELAPKAPVIVKVSRPKVARQLKFQRLNVNGYTVEPRVKFSRDSEVFATDRLVDEELRANFIDRVTDDLAP